MKFLQIWRLIKVEKFDKISKVILSPVKIHIVDFKKLEIYKEKFQKEREKKKFDNQKDEFKKNSMI